MGLRWPTAQNARVTHQGGIQAAGAEKGEIETHVPSWLPGCVGHLGSTPPFPLIRVPRRLTMR